LSGNPLRGRHAGGPARLSAAALLWALAAGGAQAHEAHRNAAAETVQAAPGYLALPYAPPEPGTYRLPPIRPAADGEFVDDQGARRRLHEIYAGHLTVLSFIYTHCEDANGCPLASFVVSQAAARVAQDPSLASKVRFVSLSFDPARDTPSVLADYARPFRKPGIDWRFGAPTSEQAVMPLLEAYGQDLERDASGGPFSHVLRVYLIDGQQRIRNEYTTSFLHSSMLYADIATLALQEAPAGPGPGAAGTPASTTVAAGIGPGDHKAGYEDASYTTRSRALTARDAEPARLERAFTAWPAGLPRDALNGPVPDATRIALGRRLFFDRRLSHNGTVACASCHIPDQGFTNNELMTPVGIEGRTVKRNAPTLLNVGLLRSLFHDARESRLEQQVWAPLLASNEMGNPSIGYVLDRIAALPDYPALFRAAFPDQPTPTMESVGAALAAYQRALLAGDSPFDRWRLGQDPDALSGSAKRGAALFTGKAGCSACHTIEEKSALFTDEALHNTGVGYRRSMAREAPLDVMLAPGVSVEVQAATIAASSETPPNDLGRYEITLDPADRWRYRTPGLRNVELTAPYMHDGSLRTLDDVVAFYDAGGVPNEGLDPRIRPLGLKPGERADLVAFLRSLTGSEVATLVRDAFAAPIGDRHAE
jgi:cytochrome c peroxidase